MVTEIVIGEENPVYNSTISQEHSLGIRNTFVKVWNNVASSCKNRWYTKPAQFWNNIIRPNETKMYLYQNDGKRYAWRRKGSGHNFVEAWGRQCYGIGMYGSQRNSVNGVHWQWDCCWCIVTNSEVNTHRSISISTITVSLSFCL